MRRWCIRLERELRREGYVKMSDQNSLDVALAFVAKINSHDVNGLVELMTADHVFVDALGSTFRGAEQMRQGWKGYFALFPDYAIEVTDQFNRGDVVAMFGKGSRHIRRQRQPAAGELLGNSRCVESRRQRGRVAEWRVYCDNEPARKIMAANTPAKPAH